MEAAEARNTPYVHHTISLPSLPGNPPTKISALLHPSMIPLLPSPIPFATPPIANPPFKIRSTPTKGFGMFASRPILQGSLIFIEHPAFVVPAMPLPEESRFEMYEEVGRRMPREKYEEMLTMVNCKGKDECPSVVEGVARTNAVSLQFKFPPSSTPIEGGQLYGGPFLKINRSNHSCGPNAAYKWNFSTLSASLHALRDIDEDEEVTMTYTNPTQARSERMEKLQADYGFTCDCTWCSYSLQASKQLGFAPLRQTQAESDATRVHLRNYIATHPTYNKWAIDLCLPDDFVISSHLSILPLIHREGLQGLLPVFIEEIALCYAELGDEEQFRKWAEEVVKLCAIADEVLASKFDYILEDSSRRFSRWGWRKKMREREAALARKRHHQEDFEAEELFSPFLLEGIA